MEEGALQIIAFKIDRLRLEKTRLSESVRKKPVS
jgi:hypothetical protein